MDYKSENKTERAKKEIKETKETKETKGDRGFLFQEFNRKMSKK